MATFQNSGEIVDFNGENVIILAAKSTILAAKTWIIVSLYSVESSKSAWVWNQLSPTDYSFFFLYRPMEWEGKLTTSWRFSF